MHGSCVEGGIGGRTGKDKGRGRGRGVERQSNVDRELERESMSEPGFVGAYDRERGANLSKVSKIVAEQNHIIPHLFLKESKRLRQDLVDIGSQFDKRLIHI
jgi:hypothetical protein